MRISNQERRKIAAQLRESRDYVSCLPKLPLVQNAIDVFERMLECVHYESGNVFDHLADLIDRPTCCNVYDEIYDEYEGAVVKTASSAASAERSSRIARATASRGRSITARSAGERW